MNRVALGAGLFAIAAVVAVFSWQRAARQLEIARSCDAAVAQRWAETLELSEGLVAADSDGRYAAECRCWALIATDRAAECTQLLEELLADERAADWVPELALAKQLIRARRDRGDLRGAEQLSGRALLAYPEDLSLLRLDLMLRSAIHGEARVLAELESQLGSDEASLRRSVVLAASYRRRGDAAAALRVLGVDPPASGSPLLSAWFEQRSVALADLAQADALRESFIRWEELGGSPPELRARYALLLSTSQLGPSGAAMIEGLRASLQERNQLGDVALVRALYERLIAHLMTEDRESEALTVYDEALAEVELPALSREQLERQASSAELGATPGTPSSGEVVFQLPAELEGGVLLVSAPLDRAPDAAYEVLPIVSSQPIRVQRQLSSWPLRWVLRDRAGAVRGSGAAWPSPESGTRVQVVAQGVDSAEAHAEPASAHERRPPAEPASAHQHRPPADGRRRVFTVLLDCADWRLVGYLRARGELEFLGHMLERGHRAVLDSSPPLTAAALESLVWPERDERVSFLGLLHRMGLEVAGLASVGRNPLGFLSQLLPETPDLFEVIGAGPHVAANMLFAHGAIHAGRHAALSGPDGRDRLARQAETFRVLTPDEQRAFPELVSDPRVRSRVESIASELDVAAEMASAGEVDLLLLRIESLDVLTHALYVELTHTAQDDGQATLLAVYRYIDARLAQLDAALDSDDVLIVMSDHGIANPMEHDRSAIFLAMGEGVPRGRAPGTPELRGVPRVLAELLGVSTDWADTGVAGWAMPPEGSSQRVAALGNEP